MRLWETIKGMPNFVGKSLQMEAVRIKLELLASSPDPVLIIGETGTGKEAAAKIIHKLSPRADKPLVSVNSSGLPPTTAASALFGHKKGSFTGAERDQLGLIQQADGGTLLLDEIDHLHSDVQPQLLRFLDAGEYRGLGSQEQNTANVRLLTLTNRNLLADVEEGKFPEDLYSRISALTITLPPLRERKEDIPDLIDHFMRDAPGGTGKQLTSAATDLLMAYSWPRNVRQLRSVLRAAALVATRSEIGTESFENLQTHRKAIQKQREHPRISGGCVVVPLRQDNNWMSEGDLVRKAKELYLEHLIAELEYPTVKCLARSARVSTATIHNRLLAMGISLPRTYRTRRVTPKPATTPGKNEDSQSESPKPSEIGKRQFGTYKERITSLPIRERKEAGRSYFKKLIATYPDANVHEVAKIAGFTHYEQVYRYLKQFEIVLRSSNK